MERFKRSHFMNAVCVLQLLGPDDEKTGETLFHNVLELACKQSPDFALSLVTIDSNADLVPAIREITRQCANKQLTPVLHLETHGAATGLGLPHQRPVTWAELRPALIELNTLTRLNLLVTLAACHGSSLVHVLSITEPAAVWGLIGPTELVFPSEVRKGFSAFYATLLSALDLNAATDALRQSVTLPEAWLIESTELIFALGYGQYLAEQVTPSGMRSAELQVLKGWRKRHRQRNPRPPGLRRLIRRRLGQELDLFQKFKHHFFMLDRYPENAERFPVTKKDCEDLYELRRHGAGPGAA